MTVADEGVEYTEIYDVIAKYADMDLDHQVKALSLVADNYTPFGNLPMQDTPAIVESIFAKNDHQIWFGGRPSLAGLDAVVAIAKWGQQQDWASRLLQKVINSLLNDPDPRARSDLADGYAERLDTFTADAIRTVLKAFEEIQSSVMPPQ